MRVHAKSIKAVMQHHKPNNDFGSKKKHELKTKAVAFINDTYKQ